jgi:hypothetical protein
MTELIDLAYTTAGGIVGAAMTTYLSRNHERRHQRAEVQQRLQRVSAVRAAVHDLAPRESRTRRRPRRTAGKRLLASDHFNVSVLLEDGTDAERALREALDGLIVSALSAGVPRRVLDFAGGGEQQALRCEVIRLIDSHLGGPLDQADLDALTTACDDYREATTQLLLQALWHPWRTRVRMRPRLRALQAQAKALHQRQQAALTILTASEYQLTLDQP